MNDASTFVTENNRILIIDDEPDLCELIEFQLQKEGYKTSSLSNPWKQLDLLEILSPI